MAINNERDSNLNEAEVQTLIGMIELSEPITTQNNSEYTFFPKTEAEAKKYFGRFAVDWSDTYPILIQRGYVNRSTSGVQILDDFYE